MVARKKEHLFDNRTVERHIIRSRVTRDEYTKFVKKLPDLTEQSAPCETALPDMTEAEDEDEPAT